MILNVSSWFIKNLILAAKAGAYFRLISALLPLFLIFGCSGGSESSVTLAPLPVLSISDAEGTEGETLQFVVSINRVHDAPVSFEYTTMLSGESQASDLTETSGTGTIPVGETSTIIEVVTLDDGDPENVETFAVVLSNFVNAQMTLGTESGTGTINDNESAPALSINDITFSENGTATFTVSASATSAVDMEFDWQIEHTSTEADDFLVSGSTTEIIPTGANSVAFTVPIRDDLVDEDNEDFKIILSNAVNSYFVDSVGLGTINDNDTQPNISITDVTVEEGVTGVFTVSLSAPSERTITFDWATTDGTAVSPNDFTAGSATGVIISPLTTELTLSVLTLDDIRDEIDETMTLVLSNVVNATVADGTGAATITDNDLPPSLSIDDVTIVEGGIASFTVTLDAVSEQNVSFDYVTGNASAVAPGDFTPASGTLTIPAGSLSETIQITSIDDPNDEDQEQLNVIIFNSSNASILDGTGVATVNDNDAVPNLSINDVAVSEGSVASFTVSLDTVSGKEVRFDWTTGDTTASAGSDYTNVTSVSTVIPAGSASVTINVATLQDSIDELAETYSVTLSNPVNSGISDGTGVGTVNDDDATPSLSISDISVGEGGGAVFTVTLSAVSGLDVDFDWASADGSALAGLDYTASGATATITAGLVNATFTVPTAEDLLDENDETFTVALSNPNNASISVSNATATITDNDALPALSINNIVVTESDAAIFTISLDTVSGRDVSFDWSSADGTATSPTDYSSTSASGVTILAGATTTTVTVNTQEDLIDEISENFTVTIANPGNATISATTGTATINDNDSLPSLSVNDVTTSEGGTTTFTVTLSQTSGLDVSFDYATASDSAIAASDFTAASGSLTIPAGATSITFDVNSIENTTHEATEAFNVSLSNPSNATIADATGVGTINDDDAPPTLAINDVTITEGGSAVLTVTLTGSSDLDATFDWNTQNGTAVTPSDYTANANNLTIAAGSTTQTITITSIDDTLDENNEQLAVLLSNPSNATIADNSGTITLNDNDSQPVISINDVTVTEGGSAIFTVTLDAPSELNVQVDYATAANTAVSPADYTATSGTLTILAGSTSNTITVATASDALSETPETYDLSLTNPINTTIGDASGLGTITDDNSLPTLSIDNVTQTEGNNLVFTVTLSAVSGQDVSFDWATSNTTAQSGSDYTANSGTGVLITAGNSTATLTVVGIDDAIDENSETFVITISNPSNATIADPTGLGTITDNDATPTVAVSDETNTEGGTFTHTVTLSAPSGLDVDVDWTSSNGSATSPGDYTAGSGTASIPAGSTFTTFDVVSINDSTDEVDENYTVTLSNPSNTTIADGTGSGTIIDNDGLPTLSIDDVTITEGSTASFTVTLSAISEKDISFDWTSNNGTALAPGDYTASSGTGVTILAGTTTATLNVPSTDDSEDESQEGFSVTISNSANATIADNTGLASLNDNDTQPTLSVGDISVTEGDVATFTVTLSSVSGRNVTFDWVTADGTAAAASDYSSSSGTSVTIPEGSLSVNITVGTTEDALDENNETFVVNLSNASGATFSDSSATATITDDDALPAISINDVTQTEGTNLVFTISLSAVAGRDISVDWASANGTALAGSDYTATSGTVTISAGSTTETVTIVSIDDSLDESLETFNINLTNPVDSTIADSLGVGSLNDNDSTPSLSVGDVTITEGDTATVTITLSAPAGQDVTFDYATADGTAKQISDYTAVSATGTITEGSTTTTVDIVTADDTLDENTEDLTFTISNANFASISDADATLTVNDNDSLPTLSINDVSLTEGGTVSFTVTLSAVSEKNVSFNWATSDGTASDPGDYAASSAIGVTIPAGTTTKAIDIVSNDDALDENSETFTVTLSAPSEATLADASGQATLLDNDATPSISINDISVAEGAVDSFTVSLSAISGRSVSVDYATANGSAVSPGDYTGTAGTLVIPAGSASQPISLTTIQDAVDEVDETLNINLSNSVNASIADGLGVSTILDDDTETTISINDISIAEGAIATFTVSLSAASEKDVTFDWATSDGSALAGSDYTNTSGTGVTIPAGSTSVTINANTADDTIDEASEVFNVTISNVSDATIADAVGQATLTDDDAAPTLSIDDVAVTEGSNLVFSVSLSTASEKDVTFDWATANGTAVNPADYSGASGSGATIAAGSTTSTLTITTLDDSIDELAETLTVTISNPGNATITDASGTGTINDNDATPTLAIDDITVTEGGNLVYTVTLSATSGLDATFDWATSDNTAVAGSDYTSGSGSKTITAGTTTTTITVLTTDDSIDEASETLNLTISNPGNSTIADGLGVGTLNDNDSNPTISINDISLAEGAVASFTVTLSAASEQDVTFDWTSNDGTATGGSDYTTASATGITIAAGATSATVNVNTTDDTIDEDSEVFTVSLSNVSNATISDGSGEATLGDNDTAPSLAINDVAITEGGNLSFTATLSAASEKDVTFDWSTTDGTATSPADYSGASGSGVTISAGSLTTAVVVTTLDDSIDENPETITVNLANPSNATISDGSGTGTINDNDSPPQLSIDDVAVTEGGNLVFTVTSSALSGLDVTFDWASSDNTASAGLDYTTASGSGTTIVAGSTSVNVTVSTSVDVLDEGSETLNVTLSNPGNSTIFDGTGVGTVNDNTGAPELSVGDLTMNEGDTATVTITLSAVSGQDVTFDWGTSDGTATAPGDYTTTSGTGVTITAGNTTTTVDINTIEDTTDETNETFNVTISNPSNATIVDNLGVVTVNDDDAVPTISVDDVTAAEGGSLTFTATLNATSEKNVTFDWATSNGTAIAPGDYAGGSASGLTIPAGSTSVQFTVNSVDDVLDESAETFGVTLSNPGNATIADANGIGTLNDNDATPSITIDDITVAEGSNVVFTVTLSAIAGQDVTFDWASGNNTAIAGNDYTANSGSGTITEGTTTTTITIVTTDDALDEVAETFNINLSNPGNCTIADSQGVATLNDNDSEPTLSIDDISIVEGAVAGFTVSLSSVSGKDVSFDWTSGDQTATAGNDYTAGSATNVTIPAGAGSVAVNISTTDDSVDEASETFQVSLSNPVNGTIADGLGIATLTDNDALPTLSIDDVTVTEATGLSFTVTLSNASEQNVRFDWVTSDGTAVSPGDYSAASASGVTIPAGSTTATINITSIGDLLDESAETFTVILSNPDKATIADGTGLGTLNDDDATPSLAIDDVTVTEGGDVVFTVTLSAIAGQDVTFDWATGNDTAAAGSDFTGNSGSGVTITAGNTTQTLTILTTDDSIDEVNETFNVTITNPGNATISDGTGVGTLNDNDSLPSLSIADNSASEGDVLSLTVTLSAASEKDVSFDWATSNGTAIAGTDYTTASGSGVTIAAGSTTAVLNVNTTEDTLDEVNKTLDINLSNVSNATLSDGLAVGTINDDDALPSLSIDDITVTEGTNLVFTVTLSTASDQAVSFDWTTVDNTATSPTDFLSGSANGETIAAGNTTKTITIVSNNDSLDEISETFNVTISNPGNATISDATGVGSLNDDDSTPSLSINDLTVTEGGDAIFTVTLSAASDQDVTFDWTTSDNTALAGSDYTADSDSVTITAGNTSANITVATTNDTTDEDAQSFNLNLSNPGNASIADGTGVATLNDDDSAPSLSIDDVVVTEGTTISFTASLTAASEKDVTFDWATSNVTATAGSDYTAGSVVGATIPAGSTTLSIDVSTTDDSIDEPAETINVTLTNAANANVLDNIGIGTINDNDTAPTLSVDDVTLAEGSTFTFTVTLSAASEHDVTFDWATGDGAATAPGDYTTNSGTAVTISAGSTTTTFDVVSINDSVYESAETFTVTLSNAGNATFADATGTATITDNDTAPTLSINDVSVTEGGVATFTVTLSGSTEVDTSVSWSTSDGSAAAPADYTTGSGSVSILAGNTTGTLNVTTINDTIDEPAQGFNVVLSGPSGATIADGTGNCTVNDNDAEPTLSIDDVVVTEGGTASFTVSLSAVSEKVVTFDWATADNTANAPGDYTTNSNTGETIAAGATTANIDIVTINDVLDENTEDLTVILSNPANATIADNSGTGTLNDNDSPPTLSIDDITVTEGGVATYTVTLSAASELDVTFDWTTVDGTSVAPGDYTAGSGSKTITAGNTTTTIAVTTSDDTTYEGTENYSISLSNPANATLSDSSGAGTINDNETLPSISINDVTVTEGTNVAFSVTLTGDSDVDVTFDWATSDGTAVTPGDYSSATASATITAGNTSTTLNVATIDDSVDEPDQSFTVTLSNPGNATISDASGTGTLTDNDSEPSLSINDPSIAEGGNLTFSVSLSSASEKTITFDWGTADGTADSPGDYTTASGVGETISAGSTSTNLIVATNDDTKDELAQNMTLTISNPSNATISDASGIGTITDNDSTPTLSVDDKAVSEGDTATFTVSLSAISEQDVDFDWATAGNTAVTGSDFTAASGSNLTIPAGSASVTFDVTTLEDATYEIQEAFDVNISSPGNATIADGTGVGTINDDDTAPTLAIDDVTVSEGNVLSFTVTKSGTTDYPVTFDWATSDATAVAGSDYTAGSGTGVSIASGSTTTTLNVITTDDALDEVSETLNIVLSNAGGATFSDSVGIGTINDNDSSTSITIDDIAVTEGTNLVFTVTLSAISGQNVSFDWATSDGTATSPGDFTASSGTNTITAGNTTSTITIPTVDDAVNCEFGETLSVVLSNPVNTGIADNTGTATLADNEPSLSVNDISIAESVTATFTISVSPTCGSKDISFDYVTSDGTAVQPTDYTTASGSGTITAGNSTTTVDVTLNDDSLAEAAENLTLTISNPTNAVISDAAGVATITDNDTGPDISINDISATEGGNLTFTVTLSAIAGADVTVDYNTSDGTAVAGSDYTSTSGTATITAGNTTTTINIPTTDDTLDEVAETLDITLSNQNMGSITDATGLGTINDNDSPPTISIDDVVITEGTNATFTVSVSTLSGKDVTFNWASANGTALSGSDYTSNSGSGTITAGSPSTTLVVSTTDDGLAEVSEAFTVGLNTPGNATIADGSGQATLNDNDTGPNVTINDVAITEGGIATFTITLSASAGSDITVDWASADATAAAGNDYTAASGTATITAGNTSTTVNVTSTDDSLDEDAETFNLIISNPSLGTVTDNTGVGTLNDNDAMPTISINDIAITEGTNATFTVSLSTVSGKDVTFDWTSNDGTATAGSDYTANSGSATITAGNPSTTVNVVTTDDTSTESTENFTVTLSNPGNSTIADSSGQATLNDNDVGPNITIDDVAVTEGGVATFTITLSASAGVDINVDWTSADVTAAAGSDYTANSGTATVTAGNTTTTVNITSTDDALDEAAETFNLNLSNPSVGTITDATGVGTINDNDSTPNLTIDDVNVAEAGVLAFTVTLSAASGQDVTFDWATSDVNATAGSDYNAGSGSGVTITAGNTTSTINVTTSGDSLDEVNETLNVTISNSGNANIVDNIGIGTINDDDAAPSISIDDVTVTEGGTAIFTVSLSAASGQDVTFDWTTGDSTATAGSDYTANSGNDVTISAGSTSTTINVITTDDALSESTEEYNVVLSDIQNATTGDATGLGTINDNESTPTLSINDVAVTEGTVASFTVTLSATSGQDVTVDWTTADVTATAGSDYTSNSGTVTITAGGTTGTINITTADDNAYDGRTAETFNINLSSPGNATISDATGVGTLNDNEPLAINGVLVAGGDVLAYQVSSDSNYVVYLADEDSDGLNELYSVGVSGGGQTQISGTLTGGGNVTDFKISPNSSKVVYLADQDSDEVFELYSVDIGGGSATKLNSALSGGKDVTSFDIAGDSTKVVYLADETTDGIFEVYSVNMNGTGGTTVNKALTGGGNVTDFAISDNSSNVVYLADADTDDVFEIYSVAIGGGGSTQINTDPVSGGDVISFRISPNSNKVVYLADETSDEIFELYSNDIGGGSQATISGTLTGNEDVTDYEISANSLKVVYVADQDTDDDFQLYSVDIGGSSNTSIGGAMASGGDIVSFTISANSSKVVFLADKTTDGVDELYSVDIGGTSNTKINGGLVSGGAVTSYAISGDSSKVVYRADENTDEKFELFSVNIGGGGQATLNGSLVAGGDVSTTFAIDNSSAKVAYIADETTNGDQELYSVAIGGTGRTSLNSDLPSGAAVTGVIITPAASKAVYLCDGETAGVVELFSTDF